MIKYPFRSKFLSKFTYSPPSIRLDDTFLQELDSIVENYEKGFTNLELEKNLISKNELFASFAISKAEKSSLTLAEAEELWIRVKDDPEYDFLQQKATHKSKITQKDHDKVEFLNIVKTFRKYNEKIYPLKEYTPELILAIHNDLTKGMDIFSQYLADFDLYKSGLWRDNDDIRVGYYVPPDHSIILDSVKELLNYVTKTDKSAWNIGIFHTGLYAVHPFCNGNKRVCRILEHMLYRSYGYNSKNLYGTSYYYHIEKERYYKHLFYSITKDNLNQFLSYSMEALAYSMLGVFKTSWEMEKFDFLHKKITDASVLKILTPFVKRSSIRFKTLIKITGKKASRQTLVNYLQNATEMNVLKRTAKGKNVTYSLNTPTFNGSTILTHWLDLLREKMIYMPKEFECYVAN